LEYFDVIIVGAGPAGMWCTEKLSDTNLSVLLLEKNNEPGNKICAGGITRKGILMLDIPDEIVEQKVNSFVLHSRHFKHAKEWPVPITYTVNRLEFGNWQLQRLKNTDIQYRKNARVTAINEHQLIINGKEAIGFRYLVGADGPVSIVRKHLKLPVEKVLATVQYYIPRETVEPKMELFLDHKYFHSWYVWLFPHKNRIAVGACSNAKWLSGKKLKNNFHRWLKEKGIDVSHAEYQSFPISYDNRGLKFNNIFLVGEAAGMASGFTGEGIYQSLVSGEVVANMIKGEPYEELLAEIMKYNDYQHKFLSILQKIGPLRGLAHDLIILLLRNSFVNKRITEGFS